MNNTSIQNTSRDIVQGLRHDEEEESDRCVQCGNLVQSGDELCGHCAAENRDIEDAVNDYREER
jgi:hypothetical protein